jgi:paraquat-inducible protein A
MSNARNATRSPSTSSLDHSADAPARTRLLACRECDALLRAARAEPATLRCPRCGSVVHRAVPGRLDNALAFYSAATVFFVLANMFPIVAIEAAGNKVDATLLGAALALRSQQMNLVALVVVATTVAIPGIGLFCTTALLLLAKTRHTSRTLTGLFRLQEALRPWSMVEIFVLGALVAIVKLGSFASVVVGTGLWSLIAFMILSAAGSHAFDPLEFWQEIEPHS